jgi:transposase
LSKRRRNKWPKGTIIEETPEFIIHRSPDGTEVRETNLSFFFGGSDKPKENSDSKPSQQKSKVCSYQRDWNAYDEAQCNEEPLFMELAAELCATVEMPIYEFGRPRFPYSDMIYACLLKVYSTKSTRRFGSRLDEAVKRGYIEKRPHYSSICNYMRLEEFTAIIQKLIRVSALPIAAIDIEQEFAVDSTGFSTSTHSRYFSTKHGKDKEERTWVKAHVCCGIKSKIVTEVEGTDNTIGDTTMFISLVESTAKRFEMKELSADKAYSSRKNLQFADNVGAQPFIPFKKNAKSWALGAPAWKKMFYYCKLHEKEFMDHYHKRSNIETVFDMVKTKFLHNLRSKDSTALINEMLLKFLCHNICVVIHEMYALGLDPNFAVEEQLSM